MPGQAPSREPRAQMGFLMAGSEMVSFTLLGLLGDYLAGTMPVFTVVLTVLGVGMAFLQLVQMAKAVANKSQKPNDTKQGPG